MRSATSSVLPRGTPFPGRFSPAQPHRIDWFLNGQSRARKGFVNDYFHLGLLVTLISTRLLATGLPLRGRAMRHTIEMISEEGIQPWYFPKCLEWLPEIHVEGVREGPATAISLGEEQPATLQS